MMGALCGGCLGDVCGAGHIILVAKQPPHCQPSVPHSSHLAGRGIKALTHPSSHQATVIWPPFFRIVLSLKNSFQIIQMSWRLSVNSG